MAIQIPGRCGSTGDFFVSGVRSVFLRKMDLTPCTAVSTKVDTHQSRTPFRQIAGICRRRDGSGCGGVSR
ncbi:hypothetical protein JY433_19985, partial [Stenotrophomonas maltophilia]|nr:hypothetical protein [Stenotrophomonas maltophilia]